MTDGQTVKRSDGRMLAVLLLLTVGPSARLSAQCPDGSPPPCRTAAAARPGAAPLSVAVLPFDSRSADSSDAYLAEGVTEEITNQLSRIARLQVKTRTLVAAQWRRTPDVMESARRLNVAWVVHGHVRHAGGQLLVNVELIRAGTGEEAWASRFPRRDTDVFAVQAEVAESVAVAVGGRLSPGEQAALQRRPTRNNEAYRLYLLGNSLLSRRSAEETRRAIEAYTQATRLDPAFAAAYARIALAITAQTSFGFENTPRDSLLARGWDAVGRALALDPGSPEALLAEGAMAVEADDFLRAHASLERAVRVDSMNDEAWGQLGAMYLFVLDTARGEAASRRALALNPDRRLSWAVLYQLRFFTGRLTEALAVLDTLHSLGPWAFTWNGRSATLFRLGDGVGAVAALAERERLSGRQFDNARALFSIATGDSTSARQWLARLRSRADSGQSVQLAIAPLSMALGDREDALVALERMVSASEGTHLSRWLILNDPLFAAIRSQPRYQRLLDLVRPRGPWNSVR